MKMTFLQWLRFVPVPCGFVDRETKTVYSVRYDVYAKEVMEKIKDLQSKCHLT